MYKVCSTLVSYLALEKMFITVVVSGPQEGAGTLELASLLTRRCVSLQNGVSSVVSSEAA